MHLIVCRYSLSPRNYIHFVLNQVQKLDTMFNAAVSAVELCEKKCGCHGAQHTPCLQRKISDYFSGDGNGDIPNKMDQSRLIQILWIIIIF